jgi:predicted HTH domain antitoxin
MRERTLSWRTLFAPFSLRPDLREAIACRRYERGDISLGFAAAWAGHDIESFKEVLARHNIVRVAPETPSELEDIAAIARNIAGR